MGDSVIYVSHVFAFSYNLVYFPVSTVLNHTCQLSRFYRESPSFSSNLPGSRLEHQISREIRGFFRILFFH